MKSSTQNSVGSVHNAAEREGGGRRERERDRDRQTDRQTDRDRQTESGSNAQGHFRPG